MAGILGVLSKAIAFVMIIVMGYLLKRKGFFHANDFFLISRIVVRITLPAAIVWNFSQITINHALLWTVVVGLVANIITVSVGYLINLKHSKADRVFDMVNLSGYNVGNFTLPFVQSFLGEVGFAATSLFDAGNALMCTGGTFTLAAMVAGDEDQKITVKAMLRSLFSSVPFDAYIIMTILAIAGIKLPQIVTTFARTIGNANAFLALLMIGIGFEIHLEREKIKKIMKLISLRYGMAVLFAGVAFFLLPFSLEVRQALVLIAFGPVSSVAPAFTARLGGDVEMASAVNSISIILSIITITLMLIIML